MACPENKCSMPGGCMLTFRLRLLLAFACCML
jgi:hypothetical protein